MKLHGRNIIVMADDIAIAAAKACEITAQADLIEKASPTSGKAREFVLGRTGWKITITKYLYSVNTDILRVGKKVKLIIASVVDTNTGRVLSTDRMVGEAFCTTCTENGTVGSLATGTLEFTGTGELLPSTEPVPEPEPEPTPEPTPEPEPEPELPVQGFKGATTELADIDSIATTATGEVLAQKLKPGATNYIKVLTGPDYHASLFSIVSEYVKEWGMSGNIMHITTTRGLPDGTTIEIYYANELVAIGVIDNVIEDIVTVKWVKDRTSGSNYLLQLYEITPSPCPRDIFVTITEEWSEIHPVTHETIVHTETYYGLIPVGNEAGGHLMRTDLEGNIVCRGLIKSMIAEDVEFIELTPA